MARSKKNPAPDVDEALAAAASAVEQVHSGDDGPSRAIAEMKEDTWEWKTRKLLQAPFDPRNVWPPNKGWSGWHVNPMAIMDRLELVFGISKFDVRFDGVRCEISVDDESGRSFSRTGGGDPGDTEYTSLVAAAASMGVGRYLMRLTKADIDSGRLPEWAKPRVSDPNETIYPFPGSVAAAATEPAKTTTTPDLPFPPKKKDEPKPEPAKAPEPEKPKPPTLEGELARWEQMIRMMDVSGFNEMLKLKFGTLPAEFKPKIWALIQRIAKEDMGWLYDKDGKEFFVPDGDGAEDAVPW